MTKKGGKRGDSFAARSAAAKKGWETRRRGGAKARDSSTQRTQPTKPSKGRPPAGPLRSATTSARGRARSLAASARQSLKSGGGAKAARSLATAKRAAEFYKATNTGTKRSPSKRGDSKQAGTTASKPKSTKSASQQPRQSRQDRLISRVESKIAGNSRERLVVVRDGKIVAKPRGRSAEVSVPDSINLRGATVTHNHPHARGQKITSPLSYADLQVAGDRGAREMRAVGLSRQYSYRPKSPSAEITQRTYDRIAKEELSGLRSRMTSFVKGLDARIAVAKRSGDRAKARKLQGMRNRAKTGINNNSGYAIGALVNRRLKREFGLNLTSRRARPLQTTTRARR